MEQEAQDGFLFVVCITSIIGVGPGLDTVFFKQRIRSPEEERVIGGVGDVAKHTRDSVLMLGGGTGGEMREHPNSVSDIWSCPEC